FLVIAIGVVMCVFAVHALSGFRIPVGRGPMSQIGVGLTAGVCGGLSAIWAPPIAMYLLSLNVSRDRFVSGCGFLFLVGSLPLAAGLTVSGVLNSRTMALSMVALVVSILAFRLGAALRSRLANDTFRKAALIAFLVFGARPIVTGVTRSDASRLGSRPPCDTPKPASPTAFDLLQVPVPEPAVRVFKCSRQRHRVAQRASRHSRLQRSVVF